MEGIPRAAVEAFGLGVLRAAEVVVGGLSNDLWRVQTDTGMFALKAMRVNAARPGFRDNIEAAYAVEAGAFRRVPGRGWPPARSHPARRGCS